MGKVKSEEKFTNEVAVNRRRKKRKKELDLLRRNVLEAKRKLREKTAPPKTHSSGFNKILNSFADRRQANDNRTQGFDNNGRRAGLKKICHRLLPSRKAQVGIFANGAKGAEIKRVNLPLNELDRARFEGDLQKVLGDGKRKSKELRPDESIKILHRPAADTIDTEAQKFSQMPAKKLERKPVQNFVAERQRQTFSGKRKLQVAIESDENIAKKPHSEMEIANAVVQCTKVETKSKNSTDKKWKRSLFQDQMPEDESEPNSETGVEQLRFSPTIGEAKVKVNPSEQKVFLDVAAERPGTKRLNFNYGQLGRMAATKYEELCTMVCADNFDTCLQEIPHIDPLKKVKQSLINFYAEACNKKLLRNDVRPEMLSAEESSLTSSYLIHSNLHKDKYFYEDINLIRSVGSADTFNALPTRGVCLDKLKKFPHREAAETCSALQSKPLMAKASEVKKRKNILPVTRGPPSSGTSLAEYDRSSLDVNYDSPRKSFRSDILDYLKIEQETASPSASELDRVSTPKLSEIPSHRKKTKLPELSAVSAGNNDVQKCDAGDPSMRNEMRMKQGRNAPEKKLDQTYGALPYEADSITEQTQNLLDVNSNSVRAWLGLDLRDVPKIEKNARPAVVNLGNNSSSTLAQIPYDRGEFMMKFLQGVNHPEPREKDRATFLPEVFVLVPENNKLQKRYLGDPLRRHQMKNVAMDIPSKNERHVPAILRKSQANKRNKQPNAAGWKTSNLNFRKLSSTSESTSLNSSFEKGQSRRPPPTASLFPIGSSNSANPECLDTMKRMSQTSQFRNRTELYDLNETALKVDRDFMDQRYSREAAIAQQNFTKGSGSVNLSDEFNIQSPAIHRRQNSAVPSNFRDGSKAKNLPILPHQQRWDARGHRGAGDEKFPVFLNRKTASTSKNRKRYEDQQQQRQGGLFPANGEPKVIIIQNPSPRVIGEDVRQEINISCIPDKHEGQIPRPDGAFQIFPRVMQTASNNTGQQTGCRQKIQRFLVPDVSSSCQNVEQLQVPRCVCKTDLQNVQHVQVPSIVYQNGMRKVVNHGYAVQEIGNNPMPFFEPTTFDGPIPQRIFQHGPSSDVQIPASCTSTCCGNTNLETQRNCNNPAEPIRLLDRRVGFILHKNQPDSFCQNLIDRPMIGDQMPRRQNYSPIISEDENCDYKYIIDPRCPQAGYQWNQIDRSGAQVHQRVIQPAYNVTDAYRPQIPHSYFSTDS